MTIQSPRQSSHWRHMRTWHRAGIQCCCIAAILLSTACDDSSPLRPDERPQASAGGPYTGEEGAAIAFDGTGSTRASSYAWNFGDGGTGTGAQPTHTYGDDGSYTVTLTVTGEEGETSEPVTTTVTVSNVAPTVSLVLEADSVPAGESIGVTGSFSDPGVADSPWEWKLEWRDGVEETGRAANTTAALGASRAYDTPGTYTVRLSVTDSDGDTGIAEDTVVVAPEPPQADIGGPYTGEEGAAIAFDGTGSTAAVSYAWDFGDGSTGTGAQPTHAYGDDGSYTVTLTVMGEEGVTSEPVTTTVTVSNAAPSVSLALDAASVPVGDGISVTGSFSDPGVADSPWQWKLEWGDGAEATGSAATTSAGIDGSRAYDAPGTYTVRLSVTDADGDTGIVEDTVVVVPEPPQADIGGPYTGEEGAAIAFDGTGSTGAVSYAWDFGDGAIGTGAQPTHAYEDDGSYIVTLTVSGSEGVRSKPVTTTVTVANVAPSVSLALESDSVLVGESISAAGSFSDPGVADSPWEWKLEWGDGTEETGSAPTTTAAIDASRSYSAVGTYTVRLSVTDADGDTGTRGRTVVVSEPPGLSADFEFDTDNLEVTFTDVSASPNASIEAWTWTFGDGTTASTRHPIRTYPAAGSYTVRLTVEDATGATSTRERTVSVNGGGPSKFVLIGAGDIAGCGVDGTGHPYQDEATAAILDRFPDASVFTAGDNAYDSGTAAEFANCYDPTWGRHKDRTRPTPGNHEYRTPEAEPYFDYFGAAAGEAGRGYYTYTLNGWLVVALNTAIPVDTGSEQEQWLRATLAAHPTTCTVAYFHHPRFSSNRGDNANVNVTPLWQALYDHGAELVISSHDHLYERFLPRSPSGAVDLSRGMRQITVGTGGGRLYNINSTSEYTEALNNETHGVLKLVLEDTAYTWEFIPVAGGSFTDSGRRACH